MEIIFVSLRQIISFMRNIFKRFLALLVLASVGLQSLVIYAPQLREDLTKIWAFEPNEETENSETKTEKAENEKENVENDWFHSLNSFQPVLNSAQLTHNRFFYHYLSPALSFLNPPPEMLS